MNDWGYFQADIHHLRVLRVLFEERHVSRTADRLGMTQSSVSKVLTKLRAQFDDVLLIRDQGGYQLTHKARMLEPRLIETLLQIDRLYTLPIHKTQELEAEIRIGMADDLAILLLPTLIAKINEVAPRIKLTILNTQKSTFDDLKSGKLDIVLEDPPEKGSGFYAKPLMSWPWMCLLSPDSSYDLSKFNLHDYLSAKHGMVSFTGKTFGTSDEILGVLGKERNVVLSLPTFSSIPHVLQKNDILFTVPEPLATLYADQFNLQKTPPPFEMPPLTLSMVWHHRNQYDSIHKWFRDFLLSEVFSDKALIQDLLITS